MRPRKTFGLDAITLDAWGRQWVIYSFYLDDAMPDDLKRYRRRMALGTLSEAAFDLAILHDLHAVGPILVRERDETTAWMNRTVVQYRVVVVPGERVAETKGLYHFQPTAENLAHLDDGRWQVLPPDFYRSLMSS